MPALASDAVSLVPEPIVFRVPWWNRWDAAREVQERLVEHPFAKGFYPRSLTIRPDGEATIPHGSHGRDVMVAAITVEYSRLEYKVLIEDQAGAGS